MWPLSLNPSLGSYFPLPDVVGDHGTSRGIPYFRRYGRHRQSTLPPQRHAAATGGAACACAEIAAEDFSGTVKDKPQAIVPVNAEVGTADRSERSCQSADFQQREFRLKSQEQIAQFGYPHCRRGNCRHRRSPSSGGTLLYIIVRQRSQVVVNATHRVGSGFDPRAVAIQPGTGIVIEKVPFTRQPPPG